MIISSSLLPHFFPQKSQAYKGFILRQLGYLLKNLLLSAPASEGAGFVRGKNYLRNIILINYPLVF
jgi:hypothetical protein